MAYKLYAKLLNTGKLKSPPLTFFGGRRFARSNTAMMYANRMMKPVMRIVHWKLCYTKCPIRVG